MQECLIFVANRCLKADFICVEGCLLPFQLQYGSLEQSAERSNTTFPFHFGYDIRAQQLFESPLVVFLNIFSFSMINSASYTSF